MICRRQVITLLGGTVAGGWPLVARTQQATIAVIGFLSSRSPSESAGVVAAFRQGLRESGFVEGFNLAIAFRWAEGHYDRLPALAAELVGMGVGALVAAGGTPSALAAKAATSTIPTVFSAVSDAVGSGLVTNLNRPGGNLTGMSVFASQIGAKRLELLKELVPGAAVMAYLVNPTNPNAELESKEAQAAARALGIELHVLNASTEDHLGAARDILEKMRAQGLVVAVDPFFDSRPDRLVALSARHLAASYPWREYVELGGLMSYGPSLPDSYRQAGVYVGRILKGEKPADLPVMQPTKFYLALNLKAAKQLGLEVPLTLLARADEVIE
jgi:putative ABC transport system substrate-binding protein